MALQGPSQTTEIDANRSAVYCGVFSKKRKKSAPIIEHNLDLRTPKQNGLLYLDSPEPPTFMILHESDLKPQKTSPRWLMVFLISVKENGMKEKLSWPQAY